MDGPQGTLPGANLPYTRGNTCNHSPTQLGEVTANTAGQSTNTNDLISHDSGTTTHKTGECMPTHGTNAQTLPQTEGNKIYTALYKLPNSTKK